MLSLHFFKVRLGLARGLASKRHEVHVKLLASLDACIVYTNRELAKIYATYRKLYKQIFIRELANISNLKIITIKNVNQGDGPN